MAPCKTSAIGQRNNQAEPFTRTLCCTPRHMIRANTFALKKGSFKTQPIFTHNNILAFIHIIHDLHILGKTIERSVSTQPISGLKLCT